MDTLKVFISGTMDDLREERQVVAEAIEAIGGLEWKSVMAESHGSQPFSLRGPADGWSRVALLFSFPASAGLDDFQDQVLG